MSYFPLFRSAIAIVSVISMAYAFVLLAFILLKKSLQSLKSMIPIISVILAYDLGYFLMFSQYGLPVGMAGFYLQLAAQQLLMLTILSFFMGFVERCPVWWRPTFILLSVAPLIGVGLTLTNEFHGLIIDPVTFDWGLSSPSFHYGLVYYLLAAYDACLCALAYWELVRNYFRQSKIYRSATFIIGLATLIPVAARFSLNYLAEIFGIDLMVYVLALYLTTVFIALTDVAATARNMAVDNMAEVFFVFNTYGQCVDANNAARTLLGDDVNPRSLSQREVLSQLCIGFKHNEIIKDFVYKKDDVENHYRAVRTRITDRYGHVIGTCLTINSITELKRQIDGLNVLAYTDPLTKLKTRRYFFETAETALSTARNEQKPIAILFLDLDDFKNINDTFGHDVGDRMLVEVARVCSCNMRDDDILARFGGEEFVTLLYDVTSDNALQIGERVRNQISQIKLSQMGRVIRMTASIGMICCIPTEKDTVESLIKLADDQLYMAKRNNKNRLYMRSMDNEVTKIQSVP